MDDNATLADDLGSLHLETGEVLVDREGYDYGLVAGSAPQDAGVEAGTVDGEALRPTLQYVHPAATETRFDDDAPDIGAYGLGEPPAGDTGSSDTGSGGTGSGGTDTGPEPDNDNPGKDDGCGCTSASTAASSAWVFLLLGGVLGFRRSGLVATSRPAKAQ